MTYFPAGSPREARRRQSPGVVIDLLYGGQKEGEEKDSYEKGPSAQPSSEKISEEDFFPKNYLEKETCG
jgi:hypothetical protein